MLRVVAVSAIALTLLTACGGGVAARPSRFEGLLAMMPDTPETRRGVTMVDHVRFRQIVKLDVPKGTLDDEAQGQYALELQARLDFNDSQFDAGLLSIRSAGTMWAGLDEYGRTAIAPGTSGYGPANIDGEVYAGTEGKRYVALRGRFDLSLSQPAMQAGDKCKRCSKLEQKTHNGMNYYAWGADFHTDPRRRLAPGHDQLGRSGRMVFASDRILRAEWDAGIQQLIDAPKGASLAKDPAFKQVAGKLDALDSYLGYITTETQRSTVATSDAPTLKPYRVVGVGQGNAGSKPYLSLVLVHESPELAKANVELLKQRIAQATSTLHKGPWSQQFTSVEVWSDGNLLLAKLHGNRDWKRFLDQGDPLLLHD